jgi:hypothetical protein
LGVLHCSTDPEPSRVRLVDPQSVAARKPATHLTAHNVGRGGLDG